MNTIIILGNKVIFLVFAIFTKSPQFLKRTSKRITSRQQVQRTLTQEILRCAAPSFYINSICTTNIIATLSLPA
jgi:hypothetical protein